MLSSRKIDEILLPCVIIFSKMDDLKSAEKIATQLMTPEAKVEGLIKCEKLKAAYLAAVKV